MSFVLSSAMLYFLIFLLILILHTGLYIKVFNPWVIYTIVIYRDIEFSFLNSSIVIPNPSFWIRQWHPTPVLLPGKSHGWRSLVGCSPCGREESDMTERLHFHLSLLCIEKGNGNPLQCSCLENPRDVVAQSRTWLKWLSSSSSPSFEPYRRVFIYKTKY